MQGFRARGSARRRTPGVTFSRCRFRGDRIMGLRQSRRRPLSALANLGNIPGEDRTEWHSFPLRPLRKPAIAIASADAMSWPACAMKTRAKATAPRAGKTIMSGTPASACPIRLLLRFQRMLQEVATAPRCLPPPIPLVVCARSRRFIPANEAILCNAVVSC